MARGGSPERGNMGDFMEAMYNSLNGRAATVSVIHDPKHHANPADPTTIPALHLSPVFPTLRASPASPLSPLLPPPPSPPLPSYLWLRSWLLPALLYRSSSAASTRPSLEKPTL